MRHHSSRPRGMPSVLGWIILALVTSRRPLAAEGLRLPEDWAPSSFGWADKTPYFLLGVHNAGEVDGRKTVFGYACEAQKDSPHAPLPNAYSDGYRMRTSWLHSGDLFPMLGHLYYVEPVRLHVGRPPINGARRLPQNEMPARVQMRYDTYIFPLMDQTLDKTFVSGSLHERLLYVWALSRANDAKPGLHSKVGTLGDDKRWPRERVDDIVWNWYREGDWVEIGAYRHKLLKIVPPIEADKLNRDGARMVGWIELDRHAEPTPAAEPK
jgi:hypothetical protein